MDTFTVQRAGRLKQILIDIQGIGMDALNDAVEVIVELNPSAAAPPSDSITDFSPIIASVTTKLGLLTTGGCNANATLVVPLDEKIEIGDKIRPYIAVTGGATANVRVHAFILD